MPEHLTDLTNGIMQSNNLIEMLELQISKQKEHFQTENKILKAEIEIYQKKYCKVKGCNHRTTIVLLL